MTFARTKIQPPTFRAGLIERAGLEARLDAALRERRLVVVVAPAGYGKTAVLSRLVTRLPPGDAAAWVNAEEDDDLPRVLSSLAEALEPFDPPWRVAPETLGESAQREGGLRDSAGELVNVLAAIPVERGVIILDDVQRIAVPRVFEFLTLLVDHLPHNWTLVISSRTDPLMPLARLRAHREMEDFGEADLRFSGDETLALCVAAGVAQSTAVARQLHERTNGWPAGLCLSLDAARHASRMGVATKLQQRHMFDYLASEVLAQMPQALREFLLTCSMLPELTVARCKAVSGNPQAAELLEEIERRGLFVTVMESDEFTLRLHDLFREFLEDRLRRDTPEQIPVLLQRAAAHEPDRARRLNMLLRAGMWSQAESELAEAAAILLTEESSALVLRFIEQFPPQLRQSSPALDFARGLCALSEMDWPTLHEAMARAAAGFEQAGRHREAYEARTLEALSLIFLQRPAEARDLMATLPAHAPDAATAAMASMFFYWYTGYCGPPHGPAEHLAAMVDQLHAAAQPALWYRCAPRVFIFIGRAGIAPHMQRFIAGAREAAGDNAAPLAAASVLSAWLHLWGGAIHEAREAIRQIEADSRWLGHPRSLQVPLMRLRAVWGALQGDLAMAREAQRALIEDANRPDTPISVRIMNLSFAGRSAASLDDWDGVRRALGPLRAINERLPQAHWPLSMALEAQLALRERRDARALDLLRQVVADSADADRIGLDAFVRIQLCRAELRAGSAEAAWDAVSPLVANYLASGENGGALLNGSASLQEIADAAWGHAAPAEGVAVLKGWAQSAENARGKYRTPDAAAPPGDPLLSQREFDVLHRIAQGRSNKVIARELGLSPHTVKRHVARILERLDVASRGEAAAWFARFRA